MKKVILVIAAVAAAVAGIAAWIAYTDNRYGY